MSTKPKVLISDKMSPLAAQIFRDRGIEVDVKPGLDVDALKAIIGDYDGLAVRSTTKVKGALLDAAKNLKVIGRAGIGVDNVDVGAATAESLGLFARLSHFDTADLPFYAAPSLWMVVAKPARIGKLDAAKWKTVTPQCRTTACATSPAATRATKKPKRRI